MTDAEETHAEPEGEADGDVDGLVARVAAHDEELAAEVGELERRVDELESDLAEREEDVSELEERLQRERADFQNYKKRAKEREEEIRERATEDLIERLLDVRDNLLRAVEQEDGADVRDGVEATLSTFDRVLDGENVSAIEPEHGGEVDPNVHEVVMRVEGGAPEGTIEDVYRPGYEMAGKVLRPAQVTVSEGDGEGGNEAGADGDEAGDGEHEPDDGAEGNEAGERDGGAADDG